MLQEKEFTKEELTQMLFNQLEKTKTCPFCGKNYWVVTKRGIQFCMECKKLWYAIGKNYLYSQLDDTTDILMEVQGLNNCIEKYGRI